MALEWTAIPLAWIAGVLSILSPCVWPLVPIVMTSAAGAQRFGPVYLALGLSTSFALAGGVLTLIILNLGLDTEVMRWVSALLMLIVGVILAVNRIAEKVTLSLSLLSSRFNRIANSHVIEQSFGQFGLGFLLGFVWLPCVGPTLGAAIALASMGESLLMSFVVMFAYGLGTAFMLVIAAFTSNKLLERFGGGLFAKVLSLKQVLGYLLIVLACLVLLGVDKQLQAFALNILPAWVTDL